MTTEFCTRCDGWALGKAEPICEFYGGDDCEGEILTRRYPADFDPRGDAIPDFPSVRELCEFHYQDIKAAVLRGELDD